MDPYKKKNTSIFRAFKIAIVVAVLVAAGFLGVEFHKLFQPKVSFSSFLAKDEACLELATRKFRWKTIYSKDTLSRSHVSERVFDVAVGFDLTHMGDEDFEYNPPVNVTGATLRIVLPSPRILSIDSFMKGRTLVDTQTFFSRLLEDNNGNSDEETMFAASLTADFKRYGLISEESLTEPLKRYMIPLFKTKFNLDSIEISVNDEISPKEMMRTYLSENASLPSEEIDEIIKLANQILSE